MNKKLLIIPLILLVWVGLGSVIASTSNTFTVGLPAENLSFTGDQNITRYLSLNRWTTVNNASLVLTGFGGIEELNGSFETGWDGWINMTNSTIRSTDWSDEGSTSVYISAEDESSGYKLVLADVDMSELNYLRFTSYEGLGTNCARCILYMGGDPLFDLYGNDGEHTLNLTSVHGIYNLSFHCAHSVPWGTGSAYVDNIRFYKDFGEIVYTAQVNNVSNVDFINTTCGGVGTLISNGYDDDYSTVGSPTDNGPVSDGACWLNETWDVSSISGDVYYRIRAKSRTTLQAWTGAAWETFETPNAVNRLKDWDYTNNESTFIYNVEDYVIANTVKIRINILDGWAPVGCSGTFCCSATSFSESDMGNITGHLSDIEGIQGALNPWLSVGAYDGAHEWNYTGHYSTTENTGNISASIATTLDGGACTGGTISGANCLIPFDFHSDDGGILEYSNIFVDYTQVGIENCTDGTTLNFTLYHEINKSLLTGDLEATFTIYDEIYSFDLTSQSSFKFCLTLNASEAPADAIIQYEATGYSPRNYYLVNATLTNETAEIPLYLLPTTDSTTFEITVYDSDYIIMEDIIVKTQRYYVGTNTYETVDMGLTDEFGHTLTHLELEDAFYKFVLERNGASLWSSTPIKPYCTAAPCSLILVVAGENASTFTPYSDIPNFEYNLSWNATGTNAFRYEWIATDGIAKTGRLLVEKLAGTTSTTICDESTLSAAGAIVCNITANGQYKASAYVDGDLIDNMYVQIGGLQGSFGIEGVFWTIILILTISAIGLAFDARVSIILTVLTLIGVYFLGLTVLPVSSIAAIIVLAVVVLYQMR